MFKEFDLPILFNISTTKSVDKNKLDFVADGEYDFIGRTSVDWGIQGKLHKLSFEPNPKDSFSLIQVGETVALWREREWYASQNLFLLNPKIDKIKENKLYFQAAINKEMSRYGKEYNSYPTVKSLAVAKIFLPVIENSDPDHEYTVDDIDFEYMRECIAELEQKRVAELDAYLVAAGLDDYELTDEDKNILSLSPESASDEAGASEADFGNGQVVFKAFKVNDVFGKVEAKCKKVDFDKRRDTSTVPNEEYCIPLVNAKVGDNGIMFYGRKSDWNTQEMCIDVIQNGAIATGTVYAQPQPVGVLWDAYLIKPNAEVKSVEALLYMAKCIEKITKEQFSYDKKATWNRVKDCEVSLPVTSEGDIDFDYMERYIRAIEKLAIADVVKYKDKLIETTRQIVGA